MDDLGLRIFLSSSGDVVQERVLAERVIRGLEAEYAGLAAMEAEYWDHEPVDPPEDRNSPRFDISESDVFILIIRDRLGRRSIKGSFTEETGAESAMDLEMEAARSAGLPVYCYRRKKQGLIDLKAGEKAVLDWLAGREAVDRFEEKWFKTAEGSKQAGGLTSFNQVCEFEDILEKHLREEITRRLPENGLHQKGGDTAIWNEGSPFRGLKYFDFKHAPIFFGRTRAVEEVIEALDRQAAAKRCFLLVVGKSGAGKSSLIRAGVLPVLTRPGVMEGVGLWRRAVFRPDDYQGDLFTSLALALLDENALPELGADGASGEELAEYFRNNPIGAAPLIKGGLSQAAFNHARKANLPGQPEARLVLVVDQLEDLFTLERIGPEEARDFISALAAMAGSGLVWVICTLNSDFYPQCHKFPELMSLKGGQGQYDLLPPTEKEIIQMIRKPARAAALRFEADVEAETALKNRIVSDIVEILKKQAERKNCLLMVTGPEDSGKAALIREEVLPLVTREGEVEEVGLWRRTDFRPGSSSGDLFDGLTEALLRPEALPELTADGSTREELADYIRRHPLSAAPLIKGGLSQAASDAALKAGLPSQPEARLILVIDRLEEALDTGRFKSEQAESFMEVMASLAAMGRVWVICCLDDGGLEQGRRLPHLEARLGEGHFDFLAAVKETEKVPSLVDELAAEAVRNPDRLPCLEFVLSELYRASDRKMLTYEAYRSLGPLPRVLDQRAEGVIAGLGRDGMKAFPVVFHQMVSSGPAGSGSWTALSVPLAELNAKPQNEKLVKAFLKAGLFCTVGKGSDHPRVRAAHETLFTGWERLRMWLETSRMADRVVSIKTRSASSDIKRPAPKAKRRILKRMGALFLIFTALAAAGFLGYTRLIEPIFLKGMKADSTGLQRQAASVPKAAVGVMVRQETEKIKAEAAAQLAATSQELDSARKNLGLAFKEKGLIALNGKHNNEARLYFMSSLARLDQEDSRPERAAVLGDLVTTPGFPVRLTISEQIGAANEIEAMAVSRDGRRIAAAISNGSISIWDGITGRQTTEFKAPDGAVTGLVFSPDAGLLAMTIADNKFVIWDLAKKQRNEAFKTSAETAVCLCFSSNGKLLATGAADGTIVIWNADKGDKHTTLKRHNGEVTTLDFSPDSKLLASGSTDKTVIIWSLKPGKMIKSLKGHEDSVARVRFSPDSELLVSASLDGSIRLWDTAKTEEVGLLNGGTGGVAAMDFLADGKVLASGGKDRSLKFWNLEDRSLLTVITGQDGPIDQIACLGDYGLAAVLSGKKSVRVWDVDKLVKNRPYPRIAGKVTALSYSPDGRILAAGTAEKNVHLIDVETGKQTAVLTGHGGAVYSVCFSPDGKLLASGSGDKTVRLWEVDQGKEKAVLHGHQAVVYSVCFSPYGKYLASGAGDKTVRLWDVAAAKEKAVLKGHTFPVLCVAFSPKYQQLASGSSDRTVRLWNLETGEETMVLKGHSSDLYGDVTALAYSPDGRILASTLGAVTSLGGAVRIWDVQNGNQIESLRGPQAGMTSVRFSPRGDILAVAAEDRTIRFWDAGNMEEKLILKTSETMSGNLAFSPDGRQMAAGDADGEILSWDLTAVVGQEKISDLLRKAEKDYNLQLVNIDLTSRTRRNGFAHADGAPEWPQTHPFHWLIQAESGDPVAMVKLGLMLEREKMEQEALSWYKKAVEAGDKSAGQRIEALEKWMKQQEEAAAGSG